jgi:Amt family ammonium transporter
MEATGNISWGVTATALVLLMTPGVAFFYGGLVKAKSVISMMMMDPVRVVDGERVLADAVRR